MGTKRTKMAVAVVGAGSLGRVLALALQAGGYRVTELVVRSSAASLRRARPLAKRLGAKVVTASGPIAAPCVYIAVPDDSIAQVAQELSASGPWKGKIVLHASGALSSAALAPLKRRGASVGSAHPFNSFVANSTPKELANIILAVEGDPAAVRTSQAMARAFGATPFRITVAKKPGYHAFGSMASPMVVSLLAAAEELGRRSGIKDPKAAMEPIVRLTLENYFRKGATGAFSGPLKRGDRVTIQKHLHALRAYPRIGDIYRALSWNAVERLPVRGKKELKKLFSRPVQ